MNTEDFEEEMERTNEEWKEYARTFQREHADQYAYLNERMKELFSKMLIWTYLQDSSYIIVFEMVRWKICTRKVS